MVPDLSAVRLALALGPAVGRRGAWPDDVEAWFERCWQERERYVAWRDASKPGALLGRMRRMLERAARIGARALFADGPDYPSSVLRLDRAPPVMFVKAKELVWAVPSVAIVGARAAYRAAIDVASAFARALASQGFVVVSGGAIGIDAAAHRAALAAGGQTIAVLGSGIDRPYPERNRELFADLVNRGMLVSPFPLGAPPRRSHFPQRNAVIAALARVVVVVDAQHRSGALNTASWARQLEIPMAACPGSPGCARLIARGAFTVRCADDVVAVLRGGDVPSASRGEPTDPDEERILAALGDRSWEIDSVAQQAGLSGGRAAAALIRLDLAGRVRLTPGGLYERIGSAARATNRPAKRVP